MASEINTKHSTVRDMMVSEGLGERKRKCYQTDDDIAENLNQGSRYLGDEIIFSIYQGSLYQINI